MKKLAESGRSLEDYNYENHEIAEMILNDFGDVKFKGISVS